MANLTRETILSKKSLKRETVDIPEWGGAIIVRELTGQERARYEAGFTDQVAGESTNPQDRIKRFEDMRSKIVVLAAIHESGERIFKDGDAHALNDLSGMALDRAFSVIMRLSGYTREEQDRLKKTSTDGGDSTSALH